MSITLRLIWRELNRFRWLQLFFVLNLALGLTGLVLINSLKFSIVDYLSVNLRKALTADLQINSSQAYSSEELALIRQELPADSQISAQTSFFTMVRGEKRSRLVSLTSFDTSFPLYGKIQTASEQQLSDLASNSSPAKVWMFQRDLQKLGLVSGEMLKIGQAFFEIGDALLADENSLLSFELSPKMYIANNHIASTGLMGFGSRISHTVMVRLPDYEQAELIANQLENRLYEQFTDSKARVSTYKGSNRQLATLLNRSVGYLSMIAVIALFLAAISSLYLFGNYLQRRLQDMAILNALGYQKQQIILLYLLLVAGIGIMASAVALLASSLLMPLISYLLQQFDLPDLPLRLHFEAVAIALSIGIGGSLACSLPAFSRLLTLRALMLIKQNWQANGRTDVQLLLSLPLIVLLYLVVSLQGSFLSGSIFLILFAFVVLLLIGASLSLLQLLAKLGRRLIAWQLLVRNLSRQKWRAVGCFVALGFGGFLLNLVPQVYTGVQSEIDASDKFSVPDLFLIDIQPEQVQDLEQLITAKNYKVQRMMPLIVARLQTVDGETPKRVWRNEQLRRGQRDNLDRGVRLSYERGLTDSQRIVAGELYQGDYTGEASKTDPAPISVERRFAERIGATLGSLLQFSVQGVPVWARVTSLREVKWNSFQPNFFMVFPYGVLDYAPKTFVASVASNQDETPQQLLAVQDAIVDEFANISVLDISEVVRTVLILSDRISLAIAFVALLGIVAGLVVIYAIAQSASTQRRNEINLLKVLGMGKQQLSRLFIGEFMLIALMSALAGVVLSTLAAQLLAIYYFQIVWQVNWLAATFAVFAITLISVVITAKVSQKIMTQKPWQLLRSL